MSLKILHGVSANDPVVDWNSQSTVNVRASINRFTNLVGKKVYLYNSWLTEWNGSFAWFMKAGDHSILPLMTDGTLKAVACAWNPYYNVYDQQTLKDIANGLYDSYIITQAGICKTFGYPIYMRLGAEMNINQGPPEQSSWASNPVDFVNAWRRIYNTFKAQGALNVIWVWNPNFDRSPGSAHSNEEFYPGDNYVDWVGIDMYQFSDSSDPASEIDVLGSIYGSKKPIAICEWGTNSHQWQGGTTPDNLQASWMEKFFNAVEARPYVKMVVHFFEIYFQFGSGSSNRPGQVNTPLTEAKYKQRIANPIYVSDDTVQPTDPCQSYKDQIILLNQKILKAKMALS